jgi:hypothetical protein
MEYGDDLVEMGLEEEYESEVDEDVCLLCKKHIKESEFPNIIEKALQRKYCSNLNNYFYLKDINRLINRERYSSMT